MRKRCAPTHPEKWAARTPLKPTMCSTYWRRWWTSRWRSRTAGPDGATRYRLLETIRQYARDRLLEAGEAERIRDRHADAFPGAGRDRRPGAEGAGPAALDATAASRVGQLPLGPGVGSRAGSSGGASAGQRAGDVLGLHWGRPSESESWLARLLERAGPLPDLDPVKPERVALYARAVAVQGRISQAFGNTEQTIRLAETAAVLARNARGSGYAGDGAQPDLLQRRDDGGFRAG